MRRMVGLVLTLIVMVGVVACVSDATREGSEFQRRRPAASPPAGASAAPAMPAAAPAAAQCPDAKPYTPYRLIEGIDRCLQSLSASDLAQLQDPFALNVLQKGVGTPQLWPSTVEQIVSLVAAIPGFGSNQKSYMIGEGSQIPASIASRDARRNLRYVITWGASASPSVFVSAAPTGTHPGRPVPFLQVIGYDAKTNVFNYYQYIANDGQPTRTWAWAGDSTWSRQPRSGGQGCFMCHINGALNMKELVPPWNNWASPRSSISAANIPAAVAQDPLYAGLSGADVLQNNVQSLQSRYTQGLVASSIKNGTVDNVPALLRRLIETTTINFASSFAKPVDQTNLQVPPDFFLFHSALTMPQINLSFTVPPLTIPRATHDAFVTRHAFALQQLTGVPPRVVYQQPGTSFFAFFVPVPAYEDMVAIRELINQKVIDANFAAAVLLVDVPNPIFSAPRSSLMRYARQIETAQVLASGSPNPQGVPARFIGLVSAAAQSQPACDAAKLSQCTPEQQFLFFAGQSDWTQRARNHVNAYVAALGSRIATDAGANDYLTMSVARQAQFARALGIGGLDEFSLLLPCGDLSFATCKRMNADGTTTDDPRWPSACSARRCVLAQ